MFIILAVICLHTSQVISLEQYSAFFLLMCHKEFIRCSCALSMHRHLSYLPPLSRSLASTDSASSCRNRMHMVLRTYLWCCSAFLHFAYSSPSLLSPVQLILTLSLHFSFSIFSFCSLSLFFSWFPFLPFPFPPVLISLCHLHAFSSRTLPLSIFSCLCPVFSIRIFLSFSSWHLESSRSAPLQLIINLWVHLFTTSSLGFFIVFLSRMLCSLSPFPSPANSQGSLLECDTSSCSWQTRIQNLYESWWSTGMGLACWRLCPAIRRNVTLKIASRCLSLRENWRAFFPS